MDLLGRKDWQRERALLHGVYDAGIGRTGASRIAW
jgi:hypothetical protein